VRFTSLANPFFFASFMSALAVWITLRRVLEQGPPSRKQGVLCKLSVIQERHFFRRRGGLEPLLLLGRACFSALIARNSRLGSPRPLKSRRLVHRTEKLI
jgi:hypothetical protein